jgi:hypothetical protein
MLFEREGLDKLEKIQNAPQSIKTVAHYKNHINEIILVFLKLRSKRLLRQALLSCLFGVNLVA